MAAAKLVKKLLVLILLLYAETLQVKGSRTNTDEDSDAPDAHIIYDQRQTGKYNIHVVIKDVAIVEMDKNEITDQNYNDEEYYYDEDDLTVKPLLIKPSTTSVKPLDSTTDIKTTTAILQTTMPSNENQSVVTTTLSTIIPTTTTNNKLPNNEENLNMYLSAHPPAVDTKPRSKIEPIYAIEEPVLQSRHQLQNFNYRKPVQVQSRDGSDSKILKNSRIYKVKVQRSHQPHQIAPQTLRCRSHQYRDVRGNCRGMRSSSGSILKRLFRMLITLPFKQDEQEEIDD